MSPSELLQRFTEEGVELWAEGDRLRYRAPGKLAPETLENLRSHKQELLSLLNNLLDSEFPATSGQQALWLKQQMQPHSAAYNIALALRITSPVDAAALSRALLALTDRHACLRSLFIRRNEEILQYVQPRREPFLEQIPVESQCSEQELRNQVQTSYRRPFHLETGPLFRANLFTQDDHSVLLLTVHHSVCDAQSFWVMMDELRVLYTREMGNSSETVGAPSTPFAAFAAREQFLLNDPATEPYWDFWKQELSGAPEALGLATDFSRPARASGDGGSVAFTIPGPLLARLKQSAREHGVTLFAFLLAGYQALLHRYTQERDFVIGFPTSGRDDARFAHTVGYFANMVALRADLSGDPRFAELLGRTKNKVLAALAHPCPFAALLDRLQIARDPSRTPLFQVTFNLQQIPAGTGLAAAFVSGEPPVDWGGLRISHFDLPQQEGQFDLSLEVMEAAGRMLAVFKYASDLYEPRTIERMAGHYVRVLEGGVALPGGRVSALEVLSEGEAGQLDRWNATEVAYESGSCLQDWFEAQVERTPDAIALVTDDGSLTYAEFNARANQLAHELRARGVKAETRVALFAERSLEMMVGLYGIVKAGGAWVPVDPEYPADRIHFMLEDSAAVLLLTQSHLIQKLSQSKLPMIAIDTDWPVIDRHPANNLSTEAGPDNLAYVIYTSGSTGRPKGAMNQHRGIVNRLLWMQDAYPLDSSDAVLQKTPISFDVSVWELFWPLWTGAKLVLAKPGGHREPAYLVRRIQEERITTLHFVPSMLEIFVAEAGVPECASLRRVIASGEELSWELQQRFFAKLPCELHNLYGPTEAAVDVSYWACQRESQTRRVPIGKPIANLRLEVLDPHGRRTPIGVPGELYLGGIGVGRGYQGRPALTAERFMPDPWQPGARLYRTGDQARWLADGNVEYLGRLDSQVKLRGFRIELGEIEAALAGQPGVREAAVVLRQDPQQLVAYFTGPANIAALRAAMAEKLPAYMVPAAFVALEQLPLSPNGKLDRRALPVPLETSAEEITNAPRSWTEELIAGIWRDVLQLPRVGTYDSFFQLGGHSLLVMQVLARLRQVFEVEMSVAQFFASPTVAGLAAAIEPGTTALLPIARYSHTANPPLSFAQQRMYFLQQLEPDSPFYNVPLAWQVEGSFDLAVFQQALDALVVRHAALRTRFVEENGEVSQHLVKTFSVPLAFTDLSERSDAQTEARRLGNQDLATIFALDQAPLLRVRVLRLAEHRHAIVMVLHHIVCDGWTLGLLSAELSVLYKGGSLPGLALDPIDFACWQREWMNSPAREIQAAYWRKQLAGIPPLLTLPTDYQRPPAQRYRGSTVFFSLNSSLTASLKAFSIRHDATLFMTLLAGFAALLSKYSGQRDIVIGTAVSARSRAELETLAGVFLNSLPMRMQLAPEQTFAGLLAEVRRTALEAWANQDLPFEALVDELQPERSRSVTPVYQCLLVLLNTPPELLDLGGETRVEPFSLDGTTAKLDLTLTLRESGQGIQAAFEYASDLYEPRTIERMAGHYVRVLEGGVALPGGRVSALEVLSEGEAGQLDRWNATEVAYESGSCLQDWFEAQVERTPDAIALVTDDGSLTYAEFNARANQLAHELRARGVKAETRVALFAERSLEMMVGLYGIVKAGGAWVPVDPEYPADRIHFMLEDSAAVLLLTQSHLIQKLSQSKLPMIAIDTDWPVIDRHPANNLSTEAGPDNLAYVIYTSGSTGRPKGAMNQHRGIVNRLLWMQDAYPLDSSDAVLQKTPISFDVSVWELFWPLWTGAKLVLAKPGGHREPAYLVRRIQEERITTLHFVPSMLEIFVAEAGVPECASLRRVIASGEELSWELQQRFFAKLPCELHNLYGPTEAAVDVSYWACQRESQTRRVPIGKPIANLRLEVLDPHGRRTPIGVPGELYLGGIGVGRGYQGRPALTAERFMPDPWQPGARLYRTGDQARWLADGNVEYLGRLDSQVKLRGFRIELGEIEAALAGQPGVREAAVVLRQDPQQLVAYFTGPANIAALRAAMAEKLPAYMVPAAFVALEQLPLSPNGKLDRRALPEIKEQRNETTYAAPRSDAERVLAAIWAELLNLPQVGILENFFSLGGDSIVSMQVVARARRAGYDLTVADMFANQTVAELASAAKALNPSRIQTRTASRNTRPLTSIERWFFSQNTADPHYFNQAALLETPAGLDAGKLGQVLDRLLARHDALQSRYFQGPQGWQWAPSNLTRFPLEVIQTPDLQAALTEQTEKLQSSLCLEDGTLMRGALFVNSVETPGRLLLIFHHLVIDGVSWRILLEELRNSYEGLDLSGDPTSFQEWAAGQESSIPPLRKNAQTLPHDRAAGGNLAGSADRVEIALGAEETRQLARNADRQSIQNALLGALGVALTGWTRNASVLVDVEAHGRDSGVTDTVGWFTTIQPFQIAADGPEPAANDAPQAEVLFNYLGRFQYGQGWKPASEPTGPTISPRARRSHVLEVTAYIAEERLHCAFTYSRNLHHRATIENLATVFDIALRSAKPQRTPTEDAYPLSPMQEGMLFETLLAPGKGVYWQQWTFDLSGELDPELFAQAWDMVVARHSALRSNFRWEGVPQPVQLVSPSVVIPWDTRDWTELSSEQQNEALKTYLAADRLHTPELNTAPLMRMALLRIETGRIWFVWSYHHLLLDGWSLGIVLKQVLGVYQELLERRSHYLPDAAPYRDFIAWLRSQDAGAAQQYWREKLRGFRPSTAITAGRPPAPDAAYQSRDLLLSTTITALLQEQARQHRVTTSVLVQAAWSMVLSRCAGSDDVAFGLVAATRPAEIRGIDEMVGVLINTVPLRVTVDRQVTVAEWTNHLHLRQAELGRYSHCSLAEIQAWTGLPREQALFESVLVFENFPIDQSLREQTGSLRFSNVRIEERPHYPLLLVVSPGPELLVRFSYDQSRVDDGTAQSLADSMQAVLEAMAAGLEQSVGRLPLFGPSNRRLLDGLSEGGDKIQTNPLHHFFEAQAQRTPNHIAVISDAELVNYRELNRRADYLAVELRAHGVGMDSIVGVSLERSVEMVVALLGVLKAGGAYLPLDPGYPAGRLAFMEEDSRAALILTKDGLRGNAAVLPAKAQQNPQNLAYVIYTSGSTGNPKGVMQTHRAIVNHMAWMQNTFPLGETDRVLQKTPFSFDASVWEFYAPLFVGGTLVMASPGVHQEPALLAQTIREQQVTILQLVPSQLSLLLAEAGFAQCTSLRRIFCGGEALSPDLQRRLFDALPGVELVNLYGPTEACIDSTFWVCRPGAALVPIGAPVSHTQAWILNARMEPLPPGIRGELYLGGAGLARGYLRRPGLTAERFVPNPFAPNERLYRTGDVARQLADGSLEYLGRTDSQVKLRGFRVELEEIESVLSSGDGVAQAAVMVAEDRLVGFFTPLPGARPAVSDLRARLQRMLPEHMVPGTLLELESFPLSPSGKVDRAAFAEIDITRSPKDLRVPEDPFQQLIAESFARVLQVDDTRVGAHSNFFELGGHSLLATQLVSRIRALFKVDLRLRQFFETPTPAMLAGLIRTRKNQGILPPPMISRPEASDAVLSFAQQRLWFLHQLEGARSAYNIPTALRLRGPLNITALEAAFSAMECRHETLRTTFQIRNGEVRQVVAAPAQHHLPVIDASSLTKDEQEHAIRSLWSEETGRVFDLENGPVLHVSLLRLSAGEHVLFVNWHHIATDGWSIGIFMREIASFYEAECGGRAAQLAPLPVQYADFAHWQRGWLSGEVLQEHCRYWKAKLDGAPPLLNLPLDHARPPVETYDGARRDFTISPELHAQLKAVSRQADATLFMTLLAGFAALLSRHSGQTDIVVGTPVANRNYAEIEGLIGVFVNNLALRVDLSGMPAFRDLMLRVRETALDAYSHQDLPFERLVEAVQPQRNLSHSPIFQVLFSMQTKTADDELHAYGLTLQPLDLATPAAKYDLSLYVTETPHGLSCEFEYNTNLFLPQTVDRLARQYERLLMQAVEKPAEAITKLDTLDPAQQQEILATARGPVEEISHDLSLSEMFQRTAQRLPENIAVTSGDASLTYAELAVRVEQLARGLAAEGVGPDVLVGILMPRGIDMLVSVLAVERAGGAYVPLDPAYPADRIRFMQEDSGVRLLLTETNLSEITRGSAEYKSAYPGNLAYVIYTSGSTGRPKGVQVTRRNLANFLRSMSCEPGLQPEDVLVAVTTLSFDIAALELYLPLVTGARVVIATQEEAADGPRLLHLLRRSGATVMQATPATWRILLESGWSGDPSLRVFCGGEALPLDLAAKLQELGLRVWNLYGPTETTIWSSLSPLHQDPPGETISIGRPILNTNLYVLDSHMRLQPAGVPGDLYIGGEGVARGYLRRGALTAAAFLPDPFSAFSGSRLYRTGDIARLLPDGRLECLGRTDQQTKLHGFRIELGEIEAVLAEHPQVSQAVAAVRDERLVAYIVVRAHGDASVSELRRLLDARVPRHMVPSLFVKVDALPMTANGKIDRRALPVAHTTVSMDAAPVIPPSNAMETALASIWCEVLNRAAIGVYDNFFDVGGHSLLLVQVQIRLRDRLGLEVGVMELLEYPNIAALARHLARSVEDSVPQGAAGENVVETRAAQRRNAVRRQKVAL